MASLGNQHYASCIHRHTFVAYFADDRTSPPEDTSRLSSLKTMSKKEGLSAGL